MYARIGVPVLGILAFASCAPHSALPDGSVVLDETVALARGAAADVATRELWVDRDAVLVATVDENLTDVAVRLTAFKSTEVENHLGGAGIEIAALDVPEDSRVVITLTGPQDSEKAGRVHLKVRRYSRAARRDPRFAAQLEAFDAWSSGTRAANRRSAFTSRGATDLARAIELLDGPQGDEVLAAEARLIRANAFTFFAVDFRESRAEAQRAALAFRQLSPPDSLNEARARLCEALALGGIAQDRTAVNPSAVEAAAEARRIFTASFADGSPLGSLERAHAHAGLGNLALNTTQLDEAQLHLEAARAAYQPLGYVAGEVDMRASLAHVLAERGHRFEAAQQLEKMLPDIDRITDPVRRIEAWGSVASAQLNAGRSDEAVAVLLKAIANAREYELPLQESGGFQLLGYNYFYRGDLVQARTFMDQALKIARTQPGTMELMYALQGAGQIARSEGEYARALALHQEGVQRSTNPIVLMRMFRHVALDQLAAGNPAGAIVQFRKALTVDLHDPDHFAYADIRRELAETLLTHGDGSAATLAEAEALGNRALAQSLAVHDKLCEIASHHLLAMLRVQQGRLAAARAEYEKTFALVFEYRATTANPQFRMGSMEQELKAFRGYFDLVMRDQVAAGAGRPRPATPAQQSALRMLERAREAHVVSSPGRPSDPSSARRIDALLNHMAGNSLATAKLLSVPKSPGQQAQLAKLQLEMAGLRAELDRERADVVDKPFVPPAATVSARDWRALAPGAIQLSYALGNDHAYVWARDTQGLRVMVLEQSPAQIEQQLVEFAALSPQAAPEKIESRLTQLSATLLPAALLPPASRALEIVAEGRIAGVPFAGLRSPGDPRRRLVETHAVKMTTSMLAVEGAPRASAPRPLRLLALASGSGTLRSAAVVDPAPQLKAAISEIGGIARLFEQADSGAAVKLLTGSEGNVTELHDLWSSGADVVHFATHALADLRQPLASLLVLPANDAQGTPTYLTAGQVEAWRGDADLVFLSACESAVGPPRFAGGMPGLQSAFLRAGARGVIATLWPIEDVMAREFTADFYRRYTGGVSAEQALGETQRAWLAPRAGVDEATLLRRRITALAHGYYTL